MIQVTRTGAVITLEDDELSELNFRFSLDKALILRGFLAADLATQLVDLFGNERFTRKIYENVGTDESVVSAPSVWALEFLLNNPAIFRFVESVSQCGHVGSFEGRVSRQLPGGDHFQWHSDMREARRVALSINLSRPGYQGGQLDIRSRETGEILKTVSGLAFGDATLFQIDANLEHRTRPVAGDWPRVHYSGWFRSEPEFRWGSE